MARVLIPIPARDFDPTEVAVPWRVLRNAQHDVVFTTPNSMVAAADPIMLTGDGLDPWSIVPGLRKIRAIGRLLRANSDARDAYAAMATDPAFTSPIAWDAVRSNDFDALLLPGGHRARGMREYLDSAVLQHLVTEFFAADKPVGAICHGVLLAARSRDASGRSVLYGRKTTSLTWDQERTADNIARISRWWDRSYYRTYSDGDGNPRGYMSVQQEVTRALASPSDYLDVATDADNYARKTDGRHRDSRTDSSPAFVVTDGNYISARWPGDAHTFARVFAERLTAL